MEATDVSFRRVKGSLLASVAGQTVSLVGKVADARGSSLVLETSDKAVVTVNGTSGIAAPLGVGSVVEVIGYVRSDKLVDYTDHAVLSDSFDMDSYNELVDLANSAEHADLFATK